MKKFLYVLIAVLSSLSFASIVTFAAEVNSDSLEELFYLEMPSIFGVSKTAESLQNTPLSVYVVDKSELDRWDVHSFGDLLERVPGYSFYDTDFYGQGSINTRGIATQLWCTHFSFELMDIPDFGHWTITPHFFKSLEVARGPAGLMWGGNAEAGLFNFNLRDDLNGMETHIEYGDNAHEAVDIMYGKKYAKEGDGLFVGFHSESQDFVNKTNAQGLPWKENGLNPSNSVIAKIQDDKFKFLVFIDREDHIIPYPWFAIYSPALFTGLAVNNGVAHDQMDTVSYRGEYHIINSGGSDLSVYLESYKKEWFEVGMAIDTQRRDAAGFSGTTAVNDKLNINVGGDISQEATTDPSFNSQLAINNGQNWYGTGTQKIGYNSFYAQGKYKATKELEVILGGRLDNEPQATVNSQMFSGPQIGLIYMPDNKFTFKYLYNKTDRRPTGNESVMAGHPVLTPENVNASELVAMYTAEKMNADITLFSQKLADQITNFGAVQGYANTGGINASGLEWALKYLPMKKVNVYWNGNYTDSKVQTAILNGVDATAAHLTDMRPLYVPIMNNFIGAEVSVLDDLLKVNVDLRSLYNISYLDINGKDANASPNFIDLSIRTKQFGKNKVSFGLSVQNLANDQTVVPATGEHVNSITTMTPLGSRYYVSATLNF